jgi:hypothetical protein
LSLCLNKHYSMKTYGQWMYRPMSPWPRHWLEVSGQFHAQAALPPGKEPPHTHWIGGWVGPKPNLEDMEKWKFLPPPGLELWHLGRPDHSQSLCYLASQNTEQVKWGKIFIYLSLTLSVKAMMSMYRA